MSLAAELGLGGMTGELAWQKRANCLGVDPDLFFPVLGRTSNKAKAVCKRCVVCEECLEYAIVHCEKHGIWGGKSERERRRLRVEWRQSQGSIA